MSDAHEKATLRHSKTRNRESSTFYVNISDNLTESAINIGDADSRTSVPELASSSAPATPNLLDDLRTRLGRVQGSDVSDNSNITRRNAADNTALLRVQSAKLDGNVISAAKTAEICEVKNATPRVGTVVGGGVQREGISGRKEPPVPPVKIVAKPPHVSDATAAEDAVVISDARADSSERSPTVKYKKRVPDLSLKLKLKPTPAIRPNTKSISTSLDSVAVEATNKDLPVKAGGSFNELQVDNSPAVSSEIRLKSLPCLPTKLKPVRALPSVVTTPVSALPRDCASNRPRTKSHSNEDDRSISSDNSSLNGDAVFSNAKRSLQDLSNTHETDRLAEVFGDDDVAKQSKEMSKARILMPAVRASVFPPDVNVAPIGVHLSKGGKGPDERFSHHKPPVSAFYVAYRYKY